MTTDLLPSNTLTTVTVIKVDDKKDLSTRLFAFPLFLCYSQTQKQIFFNLQLLQSYGCNHRETHCILLSNTHKAGLIKIGAYLLC